MEISQINPDGNVYDIKDATARTEIAQLKAQDKYLTTEVKTAKTWIDNKPIYRRIATGTYNVPAGSYVIIVPLTELASVDTMVDMRGSQMLTANQQVIVPNIRTSLEWRTAGTNVGIAFYSQDAVANDKITICFEYTKTTD